MKFNVIKGIKKAGVYTLLLGALGCAPNLTKVHLNSADIPQHYNIDIQKEPYSWDNIKEYDYAGKLTEKELMSSRIEELAETGMKFDKKDIEAILSAMNNNDKFNYFIEKNKLSLFGSCFGYANFINPTPSELNDYKNFVDQFNHNNLKDLDLIKAVYEAFQAKIGGLESNNTNGQGWGILSNDKPLHPAVLLSEREKGVCADKAFALYDIYTQLGVKTKLVTGNRIGGINSHMWVRVCTGNEPFDLDPTFYAYFRPLNRVDHENK